MVGTILHGRWRILGQLGHGGMGEVFLAEHLELGRKEALKILMPRLARDPLFVRRFRREASAVNRLHHPNIVALYDFGELPDGRFYLSMEYAEGQALSRHHKLGARFSTDRVVRVLGQLVQAVHHAHSRGVVHRDLKPDNLVLAGSEDQLKVLDFGLAKIVASDHAESVVLSSDKNIWGTPAYLSPERASGVGDDPRSDLYSIGCIAYEMLAGMPPFRGAPPDVIYSHVTKAPEPLIMFCAEGIPSSLDAVIMRCLEKDPARRFQSAAELFSALRAVPGYVLADSSSSRSERAEARRRFARSSRSEDPSDAANTRGALRRLAEAIVDRGGNDPRLLRGVAMLREHEQLVGSLEAIQDALEHEVTATRDTILDRQGSLRLALSELATLASSPNPPVMVKGLIVDLERRLATVASDAEHLREAEDNLAVIASMRAEHLAQLQAWYGSLTGVVDEVIPTYLDDVEIHALAAKLAVARHTHR